MKGWRCVELPLLISASACARHATDCSHSCASNPQFAAYSAIHWDSGLSMLAQAYKTAKLSRQPARPKNVQHRPRFATSGQKHAPFGTNLYKKHFERSLKDPNTYWGEAASTLHWYASLHLLPPLSTVILTRISH